MTLGRVLERLSLETFSLRALGLGDKGGFSSLGGDSCTWVVDNFSKLRLLSVEVVLGLAVCLGGNVFCCVTVDM